MNFSLINAAFIVRFRTNACLQVKRLSYYPDFHCSYIFSPRTITPRFLARCPIDNFPTPNHRISTSAMAPATSSRTCCFTSSVETMIDQAKICTATRSLFVKPALAAPLSSSNWLEHGCLGNSCTDCRCCTPDLPTGQEPLCLQAAAALPSSGTRKDNVTR